MSVHCLPACCFSNLEVSKMFKMFNLWLFLTHLFFLRVDTHLENLEKSRNFSAVMKKSVRMFCCLLSVYIVWWF